jgi:hypothetical protein
MEKTEGGVSVDGAVDGRRKTWHNIPSFAEAHPGVAASWDVERNVGVTPWGITTMCNNCSSETAISKLSGSRSGF